MKYNYPKGYLVSFPNTQNFILNGILFESKNSNSTIVHIHGSYGNFYQASFINKMAKCYTDAGYNYLSFNLTCHDGFGEGYGLNNKFEYVGGAVSEFTSCISDIEGAFNFAEKFSDEIILQGHSLGCDRIIIYLLTSKKKCKFILLAPCDSYGLQTKWITPKTVESQIKNLEDRFDELKDFDWLPLNEYGVYSKNEDYILPITRKSLLSIMKGPPFKLFNIKHPCDYYIDGSCFIYLGGKDNLQTENPRTMYNYFKQRITSVKECFIPEGDHMLSNFEVEVGETVVEWLKSK